MPSQIQIKRINLLKETLNFVRWTCVLGAPNRQEDIKKTGRILKDIQNSVDLMGPIAISGSAQLRNNDKTGFLAFAAANLLTFRAGMCFAQTALSIIFLLQHDEQSIHRIDMRDGDHTFLSIGLNEDSDLLVPESIPEDAFILDPWNNIFYPAKEFKERSQQPDAYEMLINGHPEIVYSFAQEGFKSTLYSIDSADVAHFKQQLQNFLYDYTIIDNKRIFSKPSSDLINEVKKKLIPDNVKGSLGHLNENKEQRSKDYNQFALFHNKQGSALKAIIKWSDLIFLNLCQVFIDNPNDDINDFNFKSFHFIISGHDFSLLSDWSIDNMACKMIRENFKYKNEVPKWHKVCVKFAECLEHAIQRHIKFSDWINGEEIYSSQINRPSI